MNVFAILSLVFAFVFPILGLIFGIVALVQLRESHESGKGMAIAGIVISGVFMIIIPIIIIALIGAIGVALFASTVLPLVFEGQCMMPHGIICVATEPSLDGMIGITLQNTNELMMNVRTQLDGMPCSPSGVQWLTGEEVTFSCPAREGQSHGLRARQFSISYIDTGGMRVQTEGRITQPIS